MITVPNFSLIGSKFGPEQKIAEFEAYRPKIGIWRHTDITVSHIKFDIAFIVDFTHF